MPNWVIEGLLATSPRPGFVPGAERAVRREEADAWVRETRAFGVQSIICLLDRDQLPLYSRALPQGLLPFYEEHGFAIAHIPAFDGLTEPYADHHYTSAWEAFQRLPKPVLVHCSAGMDRTGRIVRHLLAGLGHS